MTPLGLHHAAREVETWDWNTWPPWNTSPEQQYLKSLESARQLPTLAKFSILFRNLDYSILKEDAPSCAALLAAVKSCVAAQDSRLRPEQVRVALRAGSVVADCTIRSLAMDDVGALRSALTASVGRLSQELSKALRASPALAAFSAEDIDVSGVSPVYLSVRPLFDQDSNGNISLSEFVSAVTKLRRQPFQHYHVVSAFQALDKDSSGFLESHELIRSSRVQVQATSTSTTATYTSSTSTVTDSRGVGSMSHRVSMMSSFTYTTSPSTSQRIAHSTTTSATSTSSVTSLTTTATFSSTTTSTTLRPKVVLIQAAILGLAWEELTTNQRERIASAYRSDLAYAVGLSASQVMDMSGRKGCISYTSSGKHLMSQSRHSRTATLAACLPIPENVAVGDIVALFASTTEIHHIVQDVQQGKIRGASAVYPSVSGHMFCNESFPDYSRAGSQSICQVRGGAGTIINLGGARSTQTSSRPRATSTSAAPRTTTTPSSQAVGVQLVVQNSEALAQPFQLGHLPLLASAFRRDLAYAAGVDVADIADARGQNGCTSVRVETWPLVLSACVPLPAAREAAAVDLEMVLTSAAETGKLLQDVSSVLEAHSSSWSTNASATHFVVKVVGSSVKAAGLRGSIGIELDVAQQASCTEQSREGKNPADSRRLASLAWRTTCEDDVVSTSMPKLAQTTSTSTAASTLTETMTTKSSTSSTLMTMATGALVRMQLQGVRWFDLTQEDRAGVAWVALQDFAAMMSLDPDKVNSRLVRAAPNKEGCVSMRPLLQDGVHEQAVAVLPVIAEACLPLESGVSAVDLAAVFATSTFHAKVSKDLSVVNRQIQGAGFSVIPLPSCYGIGPKWPRTDVQEMETYCQNEADDKLEDLASHVDVGSLRR